jgi:HD-like signal output (HDOD) protein
MMSIELRAFYKGLLSKFDFDVVTAELIQKIIAGSEKADDYEEILKKDKFFTTAVCSRASANMKASVVSSLGHGVVVVGQTSVRNMVLGHSMARIFSPTADNEFVSLEESGKLLKYSLKAEEHAKKCNNEYAGLAFAAGYIFDVFSYWIRKDPALTEALEPFLETIWKHGFRTAALAWALATHERVFISHRKLVFSAGLLHDIGKLAMSVYAFKEYWPAIEKMRSEKDAHKTNDAYESRIEREFFDLSHMEIGSALVFQTKFLRELEIDIDFHHDSTLLKTRNPDAFLGVAILSIADSIAWTMERNSSFGHEELQEILKPHAAYFPLKSPDVMELFAKIRSKGQLT